MYRNISQNIPKHAIMKPIQVYDCRKAEKSGRMCIFINSIPTSISSLPPEIQDVARQNPGKLMIWTSPDMANQDIME